MATSKEIKLKAIVDVDMGDITQVQTELQKVQQLLTVNRNQQTSLTAEILSRQKSLERPTISNETKKIVEEQIKQYEQQRKALENELKKLEMEREKINAQGEAERMMIKANAQADVIRAMGSAKADIYGKMAESEAKEMEMKNFSYEMQTRREIGLEAMQNGLTGGSAQDNNTLGELAGLGVTLGTVGSVMGMASEAMKPIIETANEVSRDIGTVFDEKDNRWDCPKCGNKGIRSKFCGECGARRGDFNE